MNWSEKYVYSILEKYSSNEIRWDFFEIIGGDGKTSPQAKKYPHLDFWVAYPDFEGYGGDKLAMLVEVKGYYDFFNNENYKLGMKYSHYKSYRDVRLAESVDVRICFVIKYGGRNIIFWDSVDNISKLNKNVVAREYWERDYKTGKMVKKKAKFIIWDAEDFRRDYENLAKV